jgi:hypothetical protein
MRPPWLRWWAEVRPEADVGDPRSLWQRAAAFIGIRFRW